jgi:hypothetical protein
MAVRAWGLRFDSGRLLFPRKGHAARRVAYVSGAVGGRAGGRADSIQRAGTKGVQCRDSWNEERQIELRFFPLARRLCYSSRVISCHITDTTKER